MKYYFVKGSKGKRYIVIAKNKENSKKILANANVATNCFYELKPDTFETEGFLINNK